MAFHTEVAIAWFSLIFAFVEMMFLGIIFLTSMTLQTEIVIFLMDLKAVQIMTVTAANPPHVHLALRK